MTTINTMELRCAYTLGYLKAITDGPLPDVDLSGVELTQPSIKEATRDVLGMLKKELKDAEDCLEIDPYDEGAEYCYDLYKQAIEAIKKLMEDL